MSIRQAQTLRAPKLLAPVAALLICTVSIAPSFAQPAEATVQANETSEEAESAEQAESTFSVDERRQKIEQRLASLDAAVLGEGDFQKTSEFYQTALTALGELQQQVGVLEKYETKITNHPNELAKYQKLLQEFPTETPTVDKTATLDELQVQQRELEAEIQATREKLNRPEAQPKTRSARLTELPKLMLETQKQLDQVQQRLETLPTDEANLLAAAEQTALESRRDFLNRSLAAMEKQRQYDSMSADLVQTRRDYRSKQLARNEKLLQVVRDVVGKRRVDDAQQQAADAAQAAQVVLPPALADLAESNSKLAQDQSEIVAEIGKAEEQLAELTKRLKSVEDQFDRSKERIEGSGMNESIGVQLRQQKEMLPSVRQLRWQVSGFRQQKSEIAYRLYELHDRRSTVVDKDLDEQVDEVVAALPRGQREITPADVRELLVAEREILDSMIENYDRYTNQLTALAAVGENLINQTQEYANFIKKKVFWIRSCALPGQADIEPAVGALKWSLNPQLWRESAAALWLRVEDSPAISLLVLGTLAGLIYLQDKVRRVLRRIGDEAEQWGCTDFWLSLRAAVVTLLLALPWPALVWFAGWWMGRTSDPSEFVRTLALALQFTAVFLLLLELLRHLCRSKGLAESHFSWPNSCVSQVRRSMRIVLCIGLPLVLWTVGLEIQVAQRLWSPTLGRVCFIALMLLFCYVSYRLLLAKRSALRQTILQHSAKSNWRWSRVWIPLVAGLPAVLAALALFGYYYTAQQLALRLMQTTAMVGVLLVLGGLTKRWILLNRRSLAREQAKQKRAAAIAALEAKGQPASSASLPEVPDEIVDLAALGEQTNKLIQTLLVVGGLFGGWFIWGEMLPALSLVGEQPIPGFALTWGKLVQFALVMVVTFIAVRNIPALLEFTVLQHLPLEAGFRYAITSVCRYVLVAIGIYLAYTSLGFDSTSIQWLVAAMGVGLGFGLQEIFANFVSGVILLFEQPIRVGDIVTLGDTTGQVNRIRMRATTIVDWDRKEYVVPNKDLVTERLLNWTLSDQTNRIVVIVGVAYGSDTQRASQLLIEAASEHPLILEDPAPSAIFDGFGDSTLNLTLRCYLPNLDKRLDTIHDLHTAIDNKFKAAGIEIAFPQLDLHVKHVPSSVHDAPTTNGNGQVANGRTSEQLVPNE